MNTRKSLISRVSVHRTIPTRIPSYDFRASGEAATTVQDVVEKQVFADCTDRGTTAAVGGELTIRRCASDDALRADSGHPCDGDEPVGLSRRASSAASVNNQFRKVVIFGIFDVTFGQTIQ